MKRPDDAELRALARINSEEMDRRIAVERARVDAELAEVRAALGELNERTVELERLNGIEREALHDVAYDGLASGDQGVVWDDFDFDQSVPPNVVKRMTDGYGLR